MDFTLVVLGALALLSRPGAAGVTSDPPAPPTAAAPPAPPTAPPQEPPSTLGLGSKLPELPEGVADVAAAAAAGAAIGWGVGLYVRDVVMEPLKNSPGVKEATPWIYGGAGAAVGAGAVLTGAGLAGAAVVAFPIAVGLLAVVMTAAAIESTARREEWHRRNAEVARLWEARQYRGAFLLAVKHAEDGYGGMGRTLASRGPGLVTELELGDAPTVEVTDAAGKPGRAAVVELLARAYAGPMRAYAQAAQAERASWRTLEGQEAFFVRWRAELEAGHQTARAIAAAQPWWGPRTLQWRPAFPPLGSVEERRAEL